MIEGIIYKYISPIGKVYIGQTINEKRRRKIFLDKKNNYGGIKINNAIKKYGANNFTYEVLEKHMYKNKEEAFKELTILEKKYIEIYDSFHNGYNSTLGGNLSESILSTESLEKMSISLKEFYKNHKHFMLGKKHSKETKEKISKKVKDFYLCHENPFKGKKHTEETKEIMSKNASKRKGNLNPFYGKHHTKEVKEKLKKLYGKPVLQIDPLTNEIINEFQSVKDANKYFNKKTSDIGKVCNNTISKNGKRHLTCFGYKWEWKFK